MVYRVSDIYRQGASGALFDTIEQMEADTIGKTASEMLSDIAAGTSANLAGWASDYDAAPDVETIRAKMRGVGAVTPELIKHVAESYKHGAVSVVNHPAEYTVTITFIDEYGVPARYEQLQTDIRKLVPAHYAIDWVMLYRLWQDVKPYTWAQVNNATWADVMEGEI